MKTILATALVVSCSLAMTHAETDHAPARFFGLYCTVKDSPAETAAFLQKCQKAGFNVLIPSLSGEGAALWQTTGEDYYPPLREKLASGYDALSEFVKEAHARGMKVIPSIAIGPVGKIAREHPEWVTKDKNGEPSSKTGPTSLAFSNPEARAAKIATLMDLVNNYAVDGVVLDYCRYPEHTNVKETSFGFYGYDAPLVEFCQKVYGFDPRKEPTDSARWSLFNELRSASVTMFVAEFRAQLKAKSENLLLIGFGDTDPAEDAAMCGRDSATWARSGLIDAFLVGTYHDTEEKMAETVTKLREVIGPKARLYTALSPFADRITDESAMLGMAKVELAADADGLWIYRDDFFEKHELWEAAGKVRLLLEAEEARTTRN